MGLQRFGVTSDIYLALALSLSRRPYLLSNASRNGVLIKGGAYLEQIGNIRAVAFDKTGTLVQGRSEVTDVIPGSSATGTKLLCKARRC